MSDVTVFFYGWFMDPELLTQQGLSPSTPLVAKLPDYKFILGQRASMIPSSDETAWGTVMTLNQDELTNLYAEPSVNEYKPVEVVCVDEDQNKISAVTYILPLDYPHMPPQSSDYARKLHNICIKLELPRQYTNKIQTMIDEINEQSRQ